MPKKFTKEQLDKFARVRNEINSIAETYTGKKARISDKQIIALDNRNKSPEWLESNRARSRRKDWLENNTRKNKELAKDPAWLEKARKTAQRTTKTTEWIEANKEGHAKKTKKREILKATDPEAYRKFCGVKDKHDASTIEKMKAKAKARWANKKRVSCQGVIYDSIYAAGEALGIHKDTVSYRIKHKPKDYFYID